jgi:hypothetical protein
MSLHDAASLDESDRLVAKDVEVAEEARHVYLSPVFKVGDAWGCGEWGLARWREMSGLGFEWGGAR